MKRVLLCVLTLIVVSLVSLARPQQRSVVPRQNKQVQLSADSMVPEGNVLHCKGNAEVRIMPVHSDENRVIIHADEVIYHPDTGEIETRQGTHRSCPRAKSAVRNRTIRFVGQEAIINLSSFELFEGRIL